VDIFKTKEQVIRGTKYSEVYPRALIIYKNIVSRTKRRPYIRSKYFKKEKIFLDYFWDHLREKNWHDRVRRLKFYSCAIDLIEHSNIRPDTHRNPMRKSEMLYRFTGQTQNGDSFFVQIKENKRKQKYFMSVFPV